MRVCYLGLFLPVLSLPYTLHYLSYSSPSSLPLLLFLSSFFSPFLAPLSPSLSSLSLLSQYRMAALDRMIKFMKDDPTSLQSSSRYIYLAYCMAPYIHYSVS